MIAREKIDKEKIAQKAKEKIVAIMKEITETSGDLQVNHTPPEICEMMLDKVDLDKAESVLVLFNVELVYELRVRGYKGQVYYFTQSTKEVGFVKKLIPDVIIKYIDKEESALDYMSTWPEKFDIIVSNPPYSKNLDLKFLSKSFDIVKDEVVFVHPSSSFIDSKGKKSIYNSINEKILPYLHSLDFFNGNGIFGINLKVPCSITKIVKTKKSIGFTVTNRISSETTFQPNFSKIHLHGISEHIQTFQEKIKEHIEKNGSLDSKGFVLGSQQEHKRILQNPNSFFVEASHIQGNNFSDGGMSSKLHKNDFFVILNKPRLSVINGRNPEFNIWWEFETEKEAVNFIKYIKTDFARFCLSLLKINQNLARGEMKLIPWMDFTQEWTDEKLYAHFGITEEEQAFIKEVIPPYYD